MVDLREIQRAGFEEVLGQMPAGVMIAEAPSGKIIFVNSQARRLAERIQNRSVPSELRDFPDLQDRSNVKIVHPDGRPYETEEWPLMRSIRTGEEVRDEDLLHLLADGSQLWLRCNSSPIYNDEGRIVAGVLIGHDITEQKRAEETQARYTAVLEATTDFVGTADADWRVLSVNQAGRRMVGMDEDEDVSNTTIPDYYPEWAHESVLEQGIPAAVRDGAWSTETAFVSRDGREIPISQVILAHKGRDGEVQYLSTIARDITERKRAEEALRESSGRTENILESITDDFIAVDGVWRFTYINERALERMRSAKGEELTREDLLGKSAREVFPEQVGSVFYQELHRALSEQKTVEFETHLPLSDRWYEVHAYPSEEGLSIYSRDITEQKRAEEQLAYHAYLLQNIHDAVMATDERAVLTAWNKGAEEMFGWRADEVLGREVYEVLPYTEYSDEQLAEALRKLTETGQRRTEAVWYDKDGTPVYAEALTIALRGDLGQITGYVSIMRDISERKRAEEAFRVSSQRIETILESITDAFYVVDRDWRITYINERALRRMQRIKGEQIAREEIVGRNIWELYPETVGSVLYQKYHEAMREQKSMEFEVYSPLSPKEWLEVRLYPSDEGLSIYYRNITERKQAEEQLQEAKRRLEDLALLKADFTAMVAHELDTPLAVISGYADMLSSGKLGSSEQSRSHALAKIRAETEVLKALVADVRAAATVEREDFAIEPRRVSVDKLLQDAAGFAVTLPGDHPLTIEIGAEGRVWADPQRIGQVLRNLLSNAAKYSPDGAPLELRVKPGETDGHARVEVVDHGEGIHPDDVSRIYEKFGRGRDRSGRKMGGAGLGLYLSRRIVLAHGSDLTLEAVPGGGSVFGFELKSAP